MANPYGAPEVDVQSVAEKLKNNESFILMDVREQIELMRVKLDSKQLVIVPLSQLAREQLAGLPAQFEDKEKEVVVICHHGNRSAQVTAWLLNNGWKNVVSMAGGVDAYARFVDPTIGFY